MKTCGHEEGGGKRGWDKQNSMKTCTLPYVKQIASGNLLCDQGSQTRAL